MFNLKVSTPKGNIFTGEVDLVNVPTTTGIIGIMENHENLISSLVTGKIEINSNGSKEVILCNGGFVKVEAGITEVLASDALMAKDLARDKIEKAIEKAKNEINKTDLSTSQLIKIEKTLRYERFKKEFFENEYS